MACEVSGPGLQMVYSENKAERKYAGRGFSAFHVEAPSDKNNNIQSNMNRRSNQCVVCNGFCRDVSSCSTFSKMELRDKWNFVRSRKLCRRCLGKHSIFKCKSHAVCGVKECQRKHHPKLHNTELPTSEAIPKPCNTHAKYNHGVLFRIVPVILHGKDISVKTYAFLDEGSSITLLDSSLADELHLEGVVDPLCLKWSTDIERLEEGSQRVSIQISGTEEKHKKYNLTNVRTVKKLDLPVQSLFISELIETFPHLRGIPLKNYINAVPRIHIGIDNWRLGLPLECKEGVHGQIVATKTRLGWVVHGISHTEKIPNTIHSANCHQAPKVEPCNCVTNLDLHKMMKEFFTVENLGVKICEVPHETIADKRAKIILKKSTKLVGNYYETGLLWSHDKIELPDSFFMAKHRDICLQKKLKKNPDLHKAMEQKIQEYISCGYARLLNLDELRAHHPRIWYLPIFPVVNPNKPGKIRIVFDAAAKAFT